MAIALSPKRPREYVLEADRASARPTVFMLTPPTHEMILALQEGRAVTHAAAQGLALVRGCLRGWRDLPDEAGADVPFDGSAGADELDWQTVSELGSECLRLSRLATAEKKG